MSDLFLLFVILYALMSTVISQYPGYYKNYDFKESEGSIPGATVFKLEKKHNDERFELTMPNEWVTVEPNGDVKVKEPWDYEQLHELELADKIRSFKFMVLVKQKNGFMETQRIKINVRNVNDELPYFVNQLPMKAKVKYNAPPGTTVFKLKARDLDEDSHLHYVLVRDYADGRFEVDEKTGEVRTKGQRSFFGFEYVIYVKAYDYGGLINGTEFQSTKVERLSIVPDFRSK